MQNAKCEMQNVHVFSISHFTYQFCILHFSFRISHRSFYVLLYISAHNKKRALVNMDERSEERELGEGSGPGTVGTFGGKR